MILVGRTGLDAALRDPTIELHRARTPLEAIGELANPIDESSPTRAVVVVGSQVDGLHEPGQPDKGQAAEFVASLRVADPAVVVLGVQNGSPVPSAYDAGILPDADPEAVRRAVRWRPGANAGGTAISHRASAGPSIPPTVETPAVVNDDLSPESLLLEPMAGAPARVPQGSDVGDLSMVALLIRGQDVLERGLEVVRERLSDPSVAFACVNQGPGEHPRSAVVAWDTACFGVLRSDRCDARTLAPHARWLAGWLRLRDQQAQLRTAAFTDALTGAWNRRYFDRFISTAVEQARAARRPLTVMVFDIDNFKHYNDLYGHDAGDDILRETVRLLRSVIRPSDRVCRVGGDEFAVIFYEPEGPRQSGSQHPTDVLTLAGRFQQQVLQHRFPKLFDCAPGTLTISGGLASFPWDGATPAELLSRADQLAMQSKRQGKNAITIGPGAMRLMEE